MTQVPQWQMMVYPPNGGEPTIIPMDQSYVLGSGIRMQITPEGDCREASFNAKGAGIRIPPLSGVRIVVGGKNVFYGEVRQGGNHRDLDGENYILRSFAQRLKEVTLPPGFKTRQQPAHLTVWEIMWAAMREGGLGDPRVLSWTFNISNLGFDARPIKAGNQQNVAAFLDQIVQDGAAMNVQVRYGVNADGIFFCTTAATTEMVAPAGALLDVKWKPPIAEAPCTAVLWFVAKKPDGTWLTHMSVGPDAATYGRRVRSVSLDPSVDAWTTLDIQRVRIYKNHDIFTNFYLIESDPAWVDITSTAKEKLSNGATADVDAGLGVNDRAKGIAVEVKAEPGVQRYMVYGGVSPSATQLGGQGIIQVYSGSTVAYIDPTWQPTPLAIYNADVLTDANGNFIESTMRLAEVVPQRINTELLDRLARYYYSTPGIAPADIELAGLLSIAGVGTVSVPDAPGGGYSAPVDAWEIRLGRDKGVTTAALTVQAKDPAALAQAELIKLRDSKAVMRAITATTQ